MILTDLGVAASGIRHNQTNNNMSSTEIYCGGGYVSPTLDVFSIDVESGFAQTGWTDGLLPEDPDNDNYYGL